MNTEPEPPHKSPLLAIFEELAKRTPPTKVDESAAALESALQGERDARHEELFIWTFVCAVFFDAAIFPNLSWIGVLALLVLELPGLIGLAAICGHERVAILL